ncbi:DNA-directed RNA polymerase subunit [Mycena kentingensis (nom. inval.)]|nr:DNA-directed RNA polymerase subunit [Mycena kentingensis (nom. inval.)]
MCAPKQLKTWCFLTDAGERIGLRYNKRVDAFCAVRPGSRDASQGWKLAQIDHLSASRQACPDHAVRKVTLRDTFLDWNQVQNILLWVQDCSVPTPAIVKPKPLWAGKQILSLLIPSLGEEDSRWSPTTGCSITASASVSATRLRTRARWATRSPSASRTACSMTIRESFESLVEPQLNVARDDSGQFAEKNLKEDNNVKEMVVAGRRAGSCWAFSRVCPTLRGPPAAQQLHLPRADPTTSFYLPVHFQRIVQNAAQIFRIQTATWSRCNIVARGFAIPDASAVNNDGTISLRTKEECVLEPDGITLKMVMHVDTECTYSVETFNVYSVETFNVLEIARRQRRRVAVPESTQ